MAVFWSIALIAVLVMFIAWIAKKYGEAEAETSQQAKTAHSLWEEHEENKHLDNIRPSTRAELYERMRRNNKG